MAITISAACGGGQGDPPSVQAPVGAGSAPSVVGAGASGAAAAGGGAPGGGAATGGGAAAGGGASATASPLGAIGFELALTGTVARFTLRNVGAAPVAVVTRVMAGEDHFDWISVTVASAGGTRRLRFTDARNRAGTEIVELAPGGTWSGEADLATWATRAANGGSPLPTGDVTVTATYEVTGRKDVWIGRADAAAVRARW